MKKFFVCALAALSFTACVNEDGLLSESKGYINLNVNTDNEMVVTRAEQTVGASELTNWTINIKKGNAAAPEWSTTQVYAAGTDYSAEVYNYVDDNAANNENGGWGAARYYGKTNSNFEVKAGQTTPVEINCGKAQNTKVTVSFTTDFTTLKDNSGNLLITDYSVTLQNRSLVFNKDNTLTAAAYYAAKTDINYTLSYKYNGNTKTVNGELNTGEAGTATNITINANTNGTISLTIKYDDAWNVATDKTITIDAATGAEVTE